MLTESIRHCLSNLATFTGRDARRQFWPYAATAFGVTMLLYMVPFALLMGQSVARMQRFMQDHPDEAAAPVPVIVDPHAIAIDGYRPDLVPDIAIMVPLVGGTALLFIVLVAAAVTRRLHDCGLPGWPALIPAILLATGMWLMSGLFGSVASGGEPDMSRFALALLNNLAYLASLCLLAACLARKGMPGTNRYGPPPA